ncbi:MAG TPA: DUF4476 domain-containing protein [Parafilimonas sp.]|nr:DUF4476 domain-containing protein [Parafilimonas sp.]
MKHSMKLISVLFFSLLVCSTLHAQQKHFIYIESAAKEPFAVVLNGKVYSSSDDGYVIVPKLTDGSYDLTVSFPMNKYPEQSFKCVISKKDLGFKLQNTADNGWALQNMQTQKVVANNNNEVAANSGFSSMLSEVVNDSNLTKKDLVAVPAPTSNSSELDNSNKADNSVADNTNSTDKSNVVAGAAIAGGIIATNSDTTASVGSFVTDSIAQLEKISETQVDTGTSLVFVDRTAGGVDTIKVFVPADTLNKVAPEQAGSNVIALGVTADEMNKTKAAENNEMVKSDAGVNESTAQADPNSVNNPFYKTADNNVPPKDNSSAGEKAAVTAQNDQPSKTIETTNMVKDDCAAMISDNDFDKVKRKMFVQNDNNAMIQVALKGVANKCIMTEQVKTLGSLFSSDDGRYNLYDALYIHVYDYGHYAQLESQILDPYYKKRFQALLR